MIIVVIVIVVMALEHDGDDGDRNRDVGKSARRFDNRNEDNLEDEQAHQRPGDQSRPGAACDR